MRRDMLSHVATMAKSSLNKHEAKLLWDYPGPADDDGTPGEDHVVRAWRVGRPDSGTYAMTVYVVPGRLIMVGDCGPLVFEREYDMVAWARRCISDPHYMFGKIPHEFKTREFSEEKAAAWLAEIRKYHRKTIGDQYDELKAMTGDLESFRYVYEEMEIGRAHV